MAINPAIPEQLSIPWLTAMAVSWAGLRRRFLRSMITMIGVILALAFLTYMLSVESITQALVAANNNKLNILLQENSVDILSGGGARRETFLLLGLALFTCTVGIVNSMLMSVTERVREIGTLKCLGASDSFIVKSYFIESALQGICGAMLGLTVGAVVAFTVMIKDYGGYTITYFPVLSVLQALLISLLAGSLMSIGAAIAPAYMAARKQPVDALRVDE